MPPWPDSLDEWQTETRDTQRRYWVPWGAPSCSYCCPASILTDFKELLLPVASGERECHPNEADLEGIQTRRQRRICPRRSAVIGSGLDYHPVSHENITYGRAPYGSWADAIPCKLTKIQRNSHQNSHSAKIKIAAKLAASYLVDFI
jgi:hypothetical protein